LTAAIELYILNLVFCNNNYEENVENVKEKRIAVHSSLMETCFFI